MAASKVPDDLPAQAWHTLRAFSRSPSMVCARATDMSSRNSQTSPSARTTRDDCEANDKARLASPARIKASQHVVTAPPNGSETTPPSADWINLSMAEARRIGSLFIVAASAHPVCSAWELEVPALSTRLENT